MGKIYSFRDQKSRLQNSASFISQTIFELLHNLRHRTSNATDTKQLTMVLSTSSQSARTLLSSRSYAKLKHKHSCIKNGNFETPVQKFTFADI